MKDKLAAGSPEALPALVWQFHSILNTAWPKPGVPQMAGGSVFLGTNLFRALDNGLSLIERALGSPENAAIGREVADFWKSFTRLFLRLKSQSRGEKSERIDAAINLLYLGSDVLYHRINELSGSVPDRDERLIGVEPLDELLALCHWAQPDSTARSVFDLLPKAMLAMSESLA